MATAVARMAAAMGAGTATTIIIRTEKEEFREARLYCSSPRIGADPARRPKTILMPKMMMLPFAYLAQSEAVLPTAWNAMPARSYPAGRRA
jgi:hypothetical protein